MGAARTDFALTGKHHVHAITINVLSDDILLEIFDVCQKNRDLGLRLAGLPESVWDWHILAHVCQRWRRAVFASPLRLDLRIFCTHGTPVRKDLYIWPTFPIHVEYLFRENIEGIDEDNVIAALEHPDRVSAVGLYRVTGPQLGKMIPVMQEPFPALAHLFLLADISNDIPILPSEFLGGSAPRLQTIELVGIPFPTLPALLLSTSDLVILILSNIPQTGYISPEAMVVALATLTRLEDLRFIFRSPASRPDRIRLPPTTRTVLPTLTSLYFHGVREYLEDFVAQIYTPRLDFICIEYFNQLVDFEIPQLWQFIDHSGSEDLSRIMRCVVEFHDDSVSFGAGTTTNTPESESFEVFPRCMDVNILGKGVDWQVSHLAQALNQISTVLSNILHFAIGCTSIILEPDEMDDIEWLELLRPFSSVQTLFVSKEFAGHISRSLEAIATAIATEVLPALDVLCLEGEPPSSVHKFIAARSESGRPVTAVDTKREFEERLMSYLN